MDKLLKIIKVAKNYSNKTVLFYTSKGHDIIMK